MLQCKTKWKKEHLKNILEDSYAGGTPNRSREDFYGGTIPWVTSGEVNQSKIIETNEYITVLGYKNSSAKMIPKNTVLLAMYGATAGQVSMLKIPATSNQAVLAIIPCKELDKNYLYHNLRYFKERILFSAQGSGQTNLSKELVEKYKITFPTNTEEQAKIADILSTCDEVIEKTEETIEKYKQIKAGMMQDLFTCGLDENGKLRPTYPQAPDLYKYSKELDRYIPKDWDIKTFNELIQKNVIDSIQDGNHGEKHPKTSDFVAAGVPFIMANNLTKDGHIDLKNCNFITYEQYKSLRIGFSTENDVLLTHKGTVGLTAIVPSGVKDIMLTPQVTYYRIKDYSKLDNQYLYTYFQSPMFQNILQGLSEQSTRAYIGITKQAELNCVYMDINEQRNMGKIVAKMNDKLKYEKDILSKYRQIKQGLMKRLLTPPVDTEIVEE